MIMFGITLIARLSFSLDCSSLPNQIVEIDIYSDTSDWVVGSLNPEGAFAVVSDSNYMRSIYPYGLRIWESAYSYNPSKKSSCYIGKEFKIQGSPIWAQLIVTADDMVTAINLNGNFIDCLTNHWLQVKTCEITSYVISGLNYINFTVFNTGGKSGLIYKLSAKSLAQGIDLV